MGSMTIFRNCTVLNGGANEPRPGCDVLVEGNRIREVADRPISVSEAAVIDVEGRTLMPGLIDAHVHVFAIHLNQSLAEDIPLTQMTAQAVPRIKAMLDRGFTTVRDTAGGDYGIKAAIDNGYIPGPRLFISGQAISPTGGHGDHRRRTDISDLCGCANAQNAICRIADGADEVRKAVRDELRKGADQIKIMASGGIGSPNDPLEARQFSAAEIAAATDEAGAWNTYVCAHSYTARSTIHAVENGVRTIEHGNLIDAEAAELMAARGVYMVPTLVCYEETAEHGDDFGLTPTIMEKLRLVNEGGIRMLELCRAAGVKMGYGTDLVGELHPAQSREFLIRAEVLPAAEVIASATSVNAEILRREGELGVIAPGALADLLVVDGDPLADLGLLQDQGAHLCVIMKDGQFHKNVLA